MQKGDYNIISLPPFQNPWLQIWPQRKRWCKDESKSVQKKSWELLPPQQLGILAHYTPLGKFSLNSLPSTKPDHLFYDTTGLFFFFHLIYIYFIELSTVCNYFNLWSVENCMCLPLDCELTELHEGWNSVLHLSYLNLCPHTEPESRERTWLPPCPKPMSGIKLLLNLLHGQ